MDWLGMKNGELLGLAAFNGFDLLITLDRNLQHQQNLEKVILKFLVLLSANNKPETIRPFVPKIKALLEGAQVFASRNERASSSLISIPVFKKLF